MAIKFPCPHCRSTLTVPDRLAGKRGACPKCKKAVTVPAAAGAAAPANATPPPPVDVEAEAAAHLTDEPAAAEAEPKTVDFPCPNCDAPLQLDAALAGKKTSCPECRRIIRVPELEKRGKKDWRQLDARLPLGARQPDQPAPEGAWQAHTSMVSGKALVEAGVVPQAKPPRTVVQKARPWVLGGLAAVVLVGGGLWGWGWWRGRATERARLQALAFADSDAARERVGPEGQAILHLGAGQYQLRTRQNQGADRAREHFGKALAAARAARGNGRDALLAELALAMVELAGPDTELHVDLPWEEAGKMFKPTLAGVGSREGKREALRAVCRRLLERDQPQRVLQLAAQVYDANDPARAEGVAVAGLELLRAGDQARAKEAAALALAAYKQDKQDEEPPEEGGGPRERPPLRPAVVALALAVGLEPPKPGKGLDETESDAVGRAEGLAHQGKWEQARRLADKPASASARLRARVALAQAAADTKAGGTTDLEAAVALLPRVKDRDKLAWPLLRLARLGAQAGLGEEALQAAIDANPDGALRGWAQLAALRARLGAAGAPVEEAAADKIDAGAKARLLGRMLLARHNVAQSRGWAKTALAWPEPERHYGALGAALGAQKEK